MPTTNFIACEPTIHESKHLQEIAFEHGWKWTANPETTIKHTDKNGLIFYTCKNIAYTDDCDKSKQCLENYTTNSSLVGVVAAFKHWIADAPLINKEKPKIPNPMQTPYELMCDELVARTKAALNGSLPTTDEIDKSVATALNAFEERINKRLAKSVTTKLVIEDRRLPTPTITTIEEPVHESVADLLGIINAGCWAALIGPAGGGKTLGCFQVARILNVKLLCIKQMTRIIAPHDLIGYMDANGKYRKGAWTDAILGYSYDNNGSILIPKQDEPAFIIVDEMDNANENVIMIIKALQTGRINMPYGMQELNTKLQVIATMNTWGTGATREYVGRCAQDAALLNEFQFQEWNYDSKFEWLLLERLFKSYLDTGKWKLEHMHTLLEMIVKMREKAETQKIRVIISTRNVINMAKMLICNPTWSLQKVLTKSVYKGLKRDEWKRFEAPEVWRKHPDIENLPYQTGSEPKDVDTLAEIDMTGNPLGDLPKHLQPKGLGFNYGYDK